MKHLAVYSNTKYGRCGWVASGWPEHALDAMERAHKNPNDIGLVGYQGFGSFQEALDSAAKWEAEERIVDLPPRKGSR